MSAYLNDAPTDAPCRRVVTYMGAWGLDMLKPVETYAALRLLTDSWRDTLGNLW
jgi:hypothetical protein